MANKITFQKVPYCIYTNDPGCLGYPVWIDHEPVSCEYEEVDIEFCECGGNAVYGEMWHEGSCEHFVIPAVAFLTKRKTDRSARKELS